jgi:hypothetical protein
MISMRNALPGIPEFFADEYLEKKIRHGQMLTTKDLIGPDGTLTDSQAGDYLKIVGREQDLVAIVQQNTAGDQWKYCCVFPKRKIVNDY